MTLVIGIVTEDYVVFASDRRRTATEDDHEYFDDVRKNLRYSDRIIVGFSGDMDETDNCIRMLRKLDDKTLNADELAHKVHEDLLERYADDKDLQQTVLIGGEGADGRMALVTVSNFDGYEHVDKITPITGEVCWNYAYAIADPDEYLNEGIAKVIEADEALTVDKTIEVASYAIDKVSETDFYVSYDHDYDYIIKRDGDI